MCSFEGDGNVRLVPACDFRMPNDSALASAAALTFRKEGAMTLAASVQIRSCLNVGLLMGTRVTRNKWHWSVGLGELHLSNSCFCGQFEVPSDCAVLWELGGVYRLFMFHHLKYLHLGEIY